MDAAVHRIDHDAHGVRVFFRTGQSVESAAAGYVVCAVPFSTLRSVAFSPALTPEKRSVIDALPYESVTRIYLQSRDRYWMREGLSGFAETDHPMEIWDSTYGQPGTRGILMSYNRGPKARQLGRESEAAQLRFGVEDDRRGLSGYTEELRARLREGVGSRSLGARRCCLPAAGTSIVARTAHRKAGGKNPLRRRARVVAARLDAGRTRVGPAGGKRD